jgi:hypothetical protein
VHVIPAGNQGAGHLLCYDNGLYTAGSRWLEVDPVSGQSFEESAPPRFGRKHFGFIMGNVQRLPNGNNLVCDGSGGRFFQVTSGGKTVWEFVDPFIPAPPLQGAIFQAHLYAPDYCPQFKSLAGAEGAAINPPDITQFRVPGAATNSGQATVPESVQQQPQPMVALLCVVALGAVALAFLMGRKSARSQ